MPDETQVATFPILVVDDDEALRRALERVLHQAGFPVTAVGTAGEAINTLRQKSFPLIVSNVVLPDLDGIALLKELKFIQPDVEIILVTAYGTVANAVEAMRLERRITSPSRSPTPIFWRACAAPASRSSCGARTAPCASNSTSSTPAAC